MPKPTRDREGLDDLIGLLTGAHWAVEDMQHKLGVSRRTAYRWIDYLVEEGHDVVMRRRDGLVLYSISQK